MYARLSGLPFSWLAQHSRPILVQGNNVNVISSPQDYFHWLKEQISTANHRIRLSSLYLGTGEQEKELVTVLLAALRNKPHLQCTIVLDYLRGNRGSPNSVSMLRPLLEKCPLQFRLHMHHTPKLRGFLKWVLPERLNEVIGLQHTKLHLFDDNVLMTGANLSQDYFTNRQDRYIAFSFSPELANYLSDIHEVIARHSFVMEASGSITNPPAIPTLNPLLSRHNAKLYTNSFTKAIQSLIQTHTDTGTQTHTDSGIQTHTDTKKLAHTNTRTETHTDTRTETHTDTRTETRTSTADYDTVIYPLIQMGQYNIKQDSLVTTKLLTDTKCNERMYMASGYFNLPHKYKKAIMSGNALYTVLASSPQCMGFYNAEGAARFVPQMYSHLANQFLRQVQIAGEKESSRIRYMEYHRSNWTYHSKGLWYYPEGETLPALTLIGSSNYGYRSLTRDLEVQVAMVTRNKALQRALDKERQSLYKYGTIWKLKDMAASPVHRVEAWVKAVTVLFKYYV